MNWNGLYGAYFEYYNRDTYDYREIIIDNWHSVMTQLDSSIALSTECLIDLHGDGINMRAYGDLGDCPEKFEYLDESLWPCGAIDFVVKNEIGRSNYEVGTAYTSRGHYRYLQWSLEGVRNEDNSWFRIQFEGPLPDFIAKWHQYVLERCRVYPQIMEDRSPKNMFKLREVFPEDYELLGKLSLFLDVDEKRFPEFQKGFFTLVDDFNAKNR